MHSLQTTWQATRGKRPLWGGFKLKLHGAKDIQISSEAHKKKSEVTEKNKHASRRKMEKFLKRALQSLAGGRGEGAGRGRRGEAVAVPIRGLDWGN